VVFVAEDTLMGRAVALKLMPADARRSPEKLQRFLLEAHTAGRLSHPHVVSVYEVDERDGRYYIAMELVRGGSVQDRLDQTGPLDWRDAVRLTAEACRGLAAAHAAGLVHRDIKPDNLLLGAEGSAKIADFGLAKAADLGDLRLTGAGASLCSPQYMSPEQCEGRPVDARTGHIPEGDGFVWTVEIRAADGRVWRSAEGFAGPPPLPAKTVETLAGLDDIHRRCADARGARHREFSVQARALADNLRRMFPGRLPVVVDPLFVGRVGGLPPHEQLTAVADELKRLNPDFNGVFDSTTTGGQVVRVVMSTAAVHDVSPLAALKGLQSLSIDGGASGGLVSDLSPIKGLAALTLLTAPNNPVRDLSPPTVLYDWSSAKMNRMLGRVGAARGASAKSGPQRAASAATAAQPVRVGLLLMVSGIRPGPGAVNVL
jgi:hypothetical protein